jgi:D-alanine-D-alanine ligase
VSIPTVSRSAGPRTLGPVTDLESHLPPDWWRTLFNAVYLMTDGDVIENEANTSQEVDLLVRAADLQPDDRILDLCCGQGRHSLELARRGFRFITGVDQSDYLINLARERARDADLAVSFYEDDARMVQLAEDSIDCVAIMGNSFGYFDQPEGDLAVLEAVRRVLRQGGTLALDLTDGDWIREHFEKRSWEWIDAEHLVTRERQLSSDGSRLIAREVVVHSTRGIIVDQFYAERLYSRHRIQHLLKQAGFGVVCDHGNLFAESDRNQDLGMMGQRVFLTAQLTGATNGILL